MSLSSFLPAVHAVHLSPVATNGDTVGHWVSAYIGDTTRPVWRQGPVCTGGDAALPFGRGCGCRTRTDSAAAVCPWWFTSLCLALGSSVRCTRVVFRAELQFPATVRRSRRMNDRAYVGVDNPLVPEQRWRYLEMFEAWRPCLRLTSSPWINPGDSPGVPCPSQGSRPGPVGIHLHPHISAGLHPLTHWAAPNGPPCDIGNVTTQRPAGGADGGLSQCCQAETRVLLKTGKRSPSRRYCCSPH